MPIPKKKHTHFIVHKCIHFFLIKTLENFRYVRQCHYHTRLHFFLCYPWFFSVVQFSFVLFKNQLKLIDRTLKNKCEMWRKNTYSDVWWFQSSLIQLICHRFTERLFQYTFTHIHSMHAHTETIYTHRQLIQSEPMIVCCSRRNVIQK